MNMSRVRDYATPGNEETAHPRLSRWARVGAAAELHVAVEPNLPAAQPGAGGVHHVAFRIPDADYQAWAERLNHVRMPSSGPVDRFWFRSLYFREPNGILFEIATDGPGFATDEPMDTLGETLSLPPFLEGRRQQIEAASSHFDPADGFRASAHAARLGRSLVHHGPGPKSGAFLQRVPEASGDRTHPTDPCWSRRHLMSWNPADDPQPGDKLACDAIETVIVPRARDLGSFEVRRALPSAQRQMVGPFIFFDQMGPSEFLLGSGMDVRPHPHIGLSTVTYLFDGEIMHRDSLGTELPIRPGELNWMTAGRGIVHSERTAPELRTTGSKLFGIQSWVALSAKDEETTPGLRPLRRWPDAGARWRRQDGAAHRRIDPRRHLAR